MKLPKIQFEKSQRAHFCALLCVPDSAVTVLLSLHSPAALRVAILIFSQWDIINSSTEKALSGIPLAICQICFTKVGA